MLRQKRFLTYFAICAVPLLLLATLNYWNATHSVSKTVEAIVENACAWVESGEATTIGTPASPP